MRIIVIALIIVFAKLSQAELSLPGQLDSSDQRLVLVLLGPGTASRLLSSPYPLGGYEGFEIGFSRHYIPTSNLASLGNKASTGGDFEYPLLTLGKGLFYDVDLFISLVPFAQSDTILHFSTQGRWNFYRSENWPFSLSCSLNGGNTTLHNRISIQSYGFDFVGSFFIRQLSLYFGGGILNSNAIFVGGTSGITKSRDTERRSLSSFHRILGVDFRWRSYFTAAEVDHYETSLYSIKVGYRF